MAVSQKVDSCFQSYFNYTRIAYFNFIIYWNTVVTYILIIMPFSHHLQSLCKTTRYKTIVKL